MNKKIMFVITGLGLGGAEKQLCSLADEFAQHNNSVMIIVLSGKIVVTPEKSNIEIINLNMAKNFIGLLLAVYKMSKIIKSFMPDVVHAHMFHANILARLTKLFSLKKYQLVCTAHSKNEGGTVRMFIYRLTDFLCNITTNVSKEALSVFIEKKAFQEKKSLAIYNGIDTKKFKFNTMQRESLRNSLNISDNDLLILAIGRLTQAKDYPNLLKALKILPSKYRLVIIGEGEARPEIEKMIVQYQLENRASLLGGIFDVVNYYSACDIYVSSSKWEGFGLVVAEAMSCQRLIVATDAGGVSEVVGNPTFIVPVSDSEALAKKITEIMSYDESTKSQIMLRNRNHIVNTFSLDSVVEKWLKIYFPNQV